MPRIIKILSIVTIFAVAMAFVESAVVVYLREIYYPNGFEFPLTQFSLKIAVTEIIREAATIIMLLSISLLADKRFIIRFAYFIYSFAIWDIFYYVFLKFILCWPESVFNWDVLFLIPTTWTGPVLAPVIVSVTMIILSVTILFFSNKNVSFTFNSLEWALFITGSIILVIAFVWDYSRYIFTHLSFNELISKISSQEVTDIVIQYVPFEFNWLLFCIGEGVIICGIAILIKRNFYK